MIGNEGNTYKELSPTAYANTTSKQMYGVSGISPERVPISAVEKFPGQVVLQNFGLTTSAFKITAALLERSVYNVFESTLTR